MVRADAARNRELILDAARNIFAARGLDAPLEEIASEAGVGIATLYRRFATREDLLAAVATRQIELFERALAKGLSDPDPWEGFSGFIRAIAEIQARLPGLAQMLMIPCHGPEDERAAAIFQGYLELVARAKKAGALRDDYVPEDLPMLLMANAGLLRETSRTAPKAWKRLVEYLLQAFRCREQQPLPSPPTPTQIRKIMSQPTD
ncbi:TetR/AcrR family transcriptional regulator [Allorhizocola rhizosphaerae]|uniref:TetR/AcrR family transcriptional regulator n=1 Tax=Allorhizocola rhizosphaerae TaxID=1872709 RepID=UPI001B8CA276|nr:TetR/AcrR family transcriptional regulator [Allorhizocola rhizosphaerae]